MTVKKIASNTRAEHMRIGIVVSRFNGAIGEVMLKGALKSLADAGAAETSIAVVSVPGALEAPLALQRMAQTGDYDALVA
ncbi:MAG: 6,7-dimethyl-8-ribityllumazine synthase, partial [Betaproteobacteria bacterium]